MKTLFFSVLVSIIQLGNCIGIENSTFQRGTTKDSASLLVGDPYILAEAKMDLEAIYGMLDPTIKKICPKPQSLMQYAGPASMSGNSAISYDQPMYMFKNVPNIRQIRVASHNTKDAKLGTMHLVILHYTSGKWFVLYCSPSHFEALFAKNLETLIEKVN